MLVVDDAAREQRGDLGVRIADGAQHFVRMLAEPRGRLADRREVACRLERQADGLHAADDRVIDLHHHVARPDMRIVHGLLVTIHRIETKVPSTSIYVGKSLDDNKLRQLRGLYVVEIIRESKTIAPVSPKEIIRENDILIFAGETDTVIDLLNNQTDLVTADYSDYPLTGKVEVVETIISPNSSLINKAINKTNFREMYDAGIIAVNRDGEKISGKVGEIIVSTTSTFPVKG